MKKLLAILMVMILLVSGCGVVETGGHGRDNDDDERQELDLSEDDEENNNDDDDDDENAAENEGDDIASNDEEQESLFAELPDGFTFSSGAGAWGTELSLNDDGTFSGSYHDSNMGESGDGYPNGTVYYCNFEGKFAEPVQISDYVYSTSLVEFKMLNEKGDFIEDGVKYIASSPYGLDNAGEILIYLYGAPRAEIEEDFISWTYGDDMGPDYLQCYGIYNVNEGDGFIGYKIEDMEVLKELDGVYKNENGDVLTIRLNEGLEQYDFDLGEVYWTPDGGETEIGNVKKNKKGGFTIYLGESISYEFEITGKKDGKIQITCVNKRDNIGVFEMQ